MAVSLPVFLLLPPFPGMLADVCDPVAVEFDYVGEWHAGDAAGLHCAEGGHGGYQP